ncbi:receptor-like protein 9DC3 [Capsicum annuum]
MERIVLMCLIISLFLFLHAVEMVSFAFVHPLCSSHDSLALLQFKHSLSVTQTVYYRESSVPKTASWNSSSMDCCRWKGVTCDIFTGHVIGLDLSNSILGGTIHPNSSLFQLHHLQTLDLSRNNFSGSHIPPNIGQLVSLVHLNLSYCEFGGRIPLEISHLSNLVSLDLFVVGYDVQLSREGFNMLFHNLTKLEVLSLSDVNISSSIPMNISSSSLRYLDLEYNKLQGDLPNSIFLLPNLETLRLSYNTHLTVSMPKFNWSSSHSLRELELSSINISGGLPTSLGTLKALKLMKLSGCNLLGHIPESIRNLSQITQLDLSDNHLDGEIPDAFSNFQKLTSLSLENNAFIGPSPASLFNLTKLEHLSLRNNLLSGPLPPFTAIRLQNLERLYLSQNSLNGSIPSWMNSLPTLSQLSLGRNRFSGPLPEFKTNSLEWLDLSENQLNGSIPQSLRDLVNLNILTLGHNNLSGKVGAEMFSSMKYLEYLDLSHSGLSWSSNRDDINITLPRLMYLGLGSCRVKDFPGFVLNSDFFGALDLPENEIHGEFPKWFGGVSKLQSLNLSHNYLTSLDHLPWETMVVLDLQSNSLTGPLPSSLCRLSKLHLINLSYNNLSAEIPNCLFSFVQLTVLDLRANNFYGPLPNKFPENSVLIHISLSKNQLEGPIPTSLVNCTLLQLLDLGNNKFRDTFPTWLETLDALEILILKSNRFYGPIFAFQKKSPFPNLRIFDLSGNSFTGSLPMVVLKGFKAMMNMDGHKSELGYNVEVIFSFSAATALYADSMTLVIKNQETKFNKILKIFTAIDLSRNKFEGEIPKLIGNLNSLPLLNLSHNNLTGHIPIEMRNMSTLEALDLSYNQLTGKIPEELASLTFLEVLNLSHNHLVGPIPRSNQFNTFPNDSYFGNPDLCGFPLSNECGRNKSALSVEQEEEEPGFLCEMTWQSVLIGYGCGLTFGFAILYIIYRFQRPRWFIDFLETITHEMIYIAKRGGRRRRNNRRRRQ